MDDNGGMVILNGDIASPEMIVHLVHEAGHVYEKTDDARFSSMNEHDVSSKVYIGDLAEKLLSERNAWAFGLKKLKPFLEKNKIDGFSIQRDDVLAIVKNQALQNYHESIKSDTDSRVAMSHFDHDYDYLLEDTDKWD